MRFPVRTLSVLFVLTVVCSGALLAQSPVVLYTFDGSQAGERLGWSVVAPGDLEGDGVPDILAGGPGDFISGGFPGIVRAYSGIDGSVLYTVSGQQNADGFGMAIAVLPDIDGDGRPDFAVGAPYDDANGVDSGSVYAFSGATGALLHKINGGTAGDAFGWSLSNARDFNNDGSPDLVIGAPLADITYPDAGQVVVCDPLSGATLASASGPAPLAEFGYAVASAEVASPSFHATDLFIGSAGFSPNGGSGSVFRWIYTVSPTLLWSGGVGYTTGLALFGFSASYSGSTAGRVAVAFSSVPNGNGVYVFGRDVYSHTTYTNETQALTGGSPTIGYCPDDSPYATLLVADGAAPPPSGMSRAVCGYSFGASFGGMPLAHLPLTRIWALASLRYLNADTDLDLAIGDSTFGANGVDAGRVLVLLAEPASSPPSVYCTAKMNSQGCTPAIGFSGAPTLSVADNFHVIASNVLNNKPGLMLWSLNQNNIPFGGGTLCVGPLFHRTALQMSHGNPPPSDCSGSYDFHFTQAYMNAQALTPGVTVYCQYYSRDDGFQAPQNIGLTDAVRFTVLP